ncbi:MAG: ATPase AAA family, partial [Candidatus Magnetoglobus multicellularis str. Araruama]
MIKKRYLTKYILDDLNEKMVFVGGPRQVGKTTLASELVSNNFSQFDYFNWDNRQDRMRMLKSEWSGNASLIIFDEIHKYNKWKTFIKGEYDKLKKKYKFILTGSARLDIYRKGGDSMQGRYFYYCLHPFTLAELINESKRPDLFKEIVFPSKFMKDEWLMLDKFGGFPEPIIKQSSRMLRRWHQDKHDRVFRDDIRDVENIRDISSIQLLGNLLPERVASPLSINSIREDLEVSHKAVSRWLNILESFYYCFRIYP